MLKLQSNLVIGVKLGSGYFGDVHIGQDEVHGEVAVKIFVQKPGETDADWQARRDSLLAEGQRLKQSAHQNVVPVLNLLESQNGDAVHLVMEYCPDGSFEKPYKKGPMKLSKVRKMATEVVLGLEALHARGMLHRDIKPANILIGTNGIARLADFGLVTDNLILGYGSQAGYADHLAYEIWHDQGTSIRSDLWALGMTLYRLLHGQSWYEESPAPRLSVENGRFAQKLKWLPHIPQEWRRVIRKLLHDDSVNRYQNSNDVMAALARLPIEPDFSCTVSNQEIHWSRRSRGRRITVTWTRHSANRGEWSALSEPVGAGRNRSLGGSNAIQSNSACIKELEEFFDGQN